MNTIAVSVGDNCVDNYLPPTNRRFIGGNALNVAVHMQKSGLPAAYIGMVGMDKYGKLTLDALREQGVDTSHVQVHPGETSRTDVRVTAEGDRQFVYEYVGPLPSLVLDGKTIDFILAHKLVHNTWMGATDKYLPDFHKGPPLVSLDFGERYTPDFVDRTIQFVDLAFFSLPEERTTEAPDLAVQMARRGPKLVVVTLGSQGSLAYDGNTHTQSALPVEVVDTLGAGDTFIGVFLAYWMKSCPIHTCLQEATRAATHTCTHMGGWQ